MSETLHALLGASSAHRWLNCPGSALLTADMPDTTSEYAQEGTLAHSVCESIARWNLQGGTQNTPEGATDEMIDCAGLYVEAIMDAAQAPEMGERPYIALEQRVDYSRWVPDGFGTADCIIIGNGVLHVIDYKHGKGVHVDADDNPQLMLYVLGALERYAPLYVINTVRWSIVQPRNGGVSHAPDMTVDAILYWAENTVRPAAKLAMTPDAPFLPGDWCRFCKAKGSCRARSDYNLSLECFEKKDPRLMGADEIGLILQRGKDLAKWLTDIEDYALSELLTGKQITGWKAVEGRAIRVWTDAEAAFKKAVELGVPETMLYERKPLTLAALEKTLGKKQFAPLCDFVTVPAGKPALAPETDKRPAIASAPTAEDDFAK